MYDKFGERGLREGMGAGGLSFYVVVFGKNTNECVFLLCDIWSFISCLFIDYSSHSVSLESLYQKLKVIVKDWHGYIFVLFTKLSN